MNSKAAEALARTIALVEAMAEMVLQDFDEKSSTKPGTFGQKVAMDKIRTELAQLRNVFASPEPQTSPDSPLKREEFIAAAVKELGATREEVELMVNQLQEKGAIRFPDEG